MNANQTDPFGGDFSQERTQDREQLPILQWHRGEPALADPSQHNPYLNGGWYISEKSLDMLGLDVNRPPSPFMRVKVNKWKGEVGWMASALNLALILTAFNWEEREGGIAVSGEEYKRRKGAGEGGTLRGRLRALVAVRELLDDQGLPLLLTVRGTYSQAMGEAQKALKAMATEATSLRRRAGHDGSIPPESFFLAVGASGMVEVGQGSNKSTVSLPTCELPDPLTRDFLVDSFVPEPYRKQGGIFDDWAARYGDGLRLNPVTTSSPSDDTASAGESRQLHGSEWADWWAKTRMNWISEAASKGTPAPEWKQVRNALERYGFRSDPASLQYALAGILGRPISRSDEITQPEWVAAMRLLNHNDGIAVMDALFPQEVSA